MSGASCVSCWETASTLIVHLHAPERNVWIGVRRREPFNTVCLRQNIPHMMSSFVIAGTPQRTEAFRLFPHGSQSIFVLIWPLGDVGFRKSHTTPCSSLPLGDPCPWHLGHIGVVLSWSITHAGSQNSLALDQEALQAQSAECRQHLIALGVSGLCLASSDFTFNHMIYGRTKVVGSCPTRS